MAALIVVGGGLVAALLDRYAGRARRTAQVFRIARTVIGILVGGVVAGWLADSGLADPGDDHLLAYLPFLVAYLVVQGVLLAVLYRDGPPIWDVRAAIPLVRPGWLPLVGTLVWEFATLVVAAALALVIDTVGLRLDYWIAGIIAFVLLVGINRLLELNALLRERNTELAHAMSELRTLNAVGHVLNATIDPDRLRIELAAQLQRLTHADAIVIALVDPARTRVRIAYYAYGGLRQPERFEEMPEPVVRPPPGPADNRPPTDHDRVPGDGIVSQALATRRPVLRSDVETFALVRPDGTVLPAGRSAVRHFHSAVGIPLQVAGDLIGAIALKSHEPDVFDRSLVDLLAQIGNQAAMAMRNAEIIAAERASNRARQDFLTVVSHELRTPITSISGYSQLLSRRLKREATLAPPRPEAVSGASGPTFRAGAARDQSAAAAPPGSSHLQMVDIIAEQSRHLGRLVDDLVTLSGLGRGNMRFEMKPVELAAVIVAAVEAARLAVDDPDCLRLEVSGDPWVVGDQRRIREVADSLIGNAIAHVPSGTLIEVWVGERAGVAEIRVSDRGPGIPLDAQAHVFEPFFRAASGDGPMQPGLGLGLSIAREIVTAHGGTISVLSDVGSGATFIVRLQLAGPAVPANTAPGAAGQWSGIAIPDRIPEPDEAT